jgi:hypothetical protein
LNVGFLAKQVLGILRFQIEIEKMFSLVGFNSFDVMSPTSPKLGLDYHYHQQLVEQLVLIANLMRI